LEILIYNIMAIKTFTKFFESNNAIYFEDSQGFDDLKEKHRISEDVIKDYFTDLIDERDFYLDNIFVNMRAKHDGIQFTYTIIHTKQLKNPTKRGSTCDAKDYLEFLDSQKMDIISVKNNAQRFAEMEDLKIQQINIYEIPFSGSGQNTKEQTNYSIGIVMTQEIRTDEYLKAKQEFDNNETGAKLALKKIKKLLKEKGVVEVERLIDSQDTDNGYIMFGFLTDDEIICVADYHYFDDKLIIHNGEVELAVKSYNQGHCEETLNP
jgi:hypothetical protein